MFKKILLYCLLFSLSFASAKLPQDDPGQINEQLINILIYSYNVSSNSKLISRNPILIFDNTRMKGAPSYIINSHEVKVGNTQPAISYKFQDYFKYNKSDFSVTRNKLPLDFFGSNEQGIYLGIDKVEGNVASVTHQGRNFYFSASKKKLAGDGVTYIVWPSETNKEKLLVYLKKAISDDRGLKNMMTDLNNCASRKEISCLKRFYEVYDLEFPADQLELLKRNHFRSKEKNFDCEKNAKELTKLEFNNGRNEYPDYFPWETFQAGLNWDNESVKLERTIKDFGDIVLVTIKSSPKSKCFMDERFELVLKKDEKTSKWNVLNLNFSELIEM